MSRGVLVAGATGQLGRAIAHDLAAAGRRVAVHCHSNAVLAAELVDELPGGGHVVVRVDLSDPGAVDAAFAGLVEWGGVDDLVNAAWPAGLARPAADTDGAAVDDAMLGVRMHANLVRAALPGLRRSRGAIVLLGGALSTRLHPGLGLFGAAKAAATVLTHVTALEEGAAGVRANVISPGRVGVASGDLAEEDPLFASLDEIGALRRVLPLPSPAEVAATVRWLLAPESSAVTGQTISLAGGERV